MSHAVKRQVGGTALGLGVVLRGFSSARQDGADELERTINALTDQVAASDPEQLRDEIRQLAGQRKEVRERITTLTEEVISLREAEVYRHPEIAPGYGGVLAAIVQRVRNNAEHHSWIGLSRRADRHPPPLRCHPLRWPNC
ncbi:hypothetical protein [Streptomyces sp. DH41]|uniref:hypothetical protein n=1 Tax=Streptomyces sp. DH41 TaxID=3040125 RepID=UPI002441E441|nr:hypothetical protein [Streptomyces sp. DH41]MDG9722756.1 hypothetical protein [Streptomyces sp. DH41]